ncbi:hypothetical protein D3C84_1191200 [compost metagenome]
MQHGTVDQRDQSHVLDQLRQCAGRLANQHRQRIAGPLQLVFEIGDGAQRTQVLGSGLLQVELGGLAAIEEFLGDLEVALLLFGVFLGDA